MDPWVKQIGMEHTGKQCLAELFASIFKHLSNNQGYKGWIGINA
jgi:hypothetical protein